MKNWYKSLSENYKTSIWTALVVLFAFLVCIPLIVIGKKEFPISILVGGAVGALFYLGLGLTENISSRKTSETVTITLMFVRLVFVVGIVFLFGYLYYRLEFHVFEPITFICAYLVSLVVLLIVHLIDAHKEKKATC
ncbi:MAG: hypothetical protein LUC16_02430 [Coprobacillus sp.]|nr:hypothetical protein [Coprobacillus sp.]